MTERKTKRIAYLLDLFPVTSETFIVREIMELQKLGLDIALFPLIDTKGTVHSDVVHEESQALQNKVHLFSSLWPSRSKLFLTWMHLKCLLRRPFRYLKTFRLARQAGGGTFTLFKRAAIYADAFRRMEVTHLHAHFCLDACKLAMLCSRISGISYSFTIHAHDIFREDLRDLFEEKFNYAKFVASISKFNRQFVLELCPSIDPAKIHIIHCGIDLAGFQKIERQAEQRFDILSVGRLVEQKGFIFLVEACRMMKNQYAMDFQCRIIGEGKERARLENAIAEQGLDATVELLGAKEQSEVVRLMNDTDVFVLPCVQQRDGAMDGIPVALMEAMAKGIPVVSTALSGIPELIANGTGKLVPPGDSRSLADALQEIQQMPLSEKRQMAQEARRMVHQQFNIATEAEKLKALFLA